MRTSSLAMFDGFGGRDLDQKLCKSNNGFGKWSWFVWFRKGTSGGLFFKNVMNFWIT
jgi:hypothetical protein